MVYYTTCDPLMAEYESDAHKYISKYGSKITNSNNDVEPMKCSTHEYAEALRCWMHDCELTNMINNSRTEKYYEFIQSENDISSKHNSNPTHPISATPSNSVPATNTHNNNNNERNS